MTGAATLVVHRPRFEVRLRRVPASERAFLGVSALSFVACATATVAWCMSMPMMCGTPGGWAMPMIWMPALGQSWAGAMASFLGMWTVMMAAMMMPSLMPMLWRYRVAIGGPAAMHRDRLTATVGMGYFLVWAAAGMAVFPIGAALRMAELESPAPGRVVPVVAGVVMLAAGAIQFTAWKARHLACLRAVSGQTLPADAATAFRHGLRLGCRCGLSCANLTAVLLILGVMDPGAMVLVTTAITAERIAPASGRVARTIGAVVVLAGLSMIA